MNDIEKFVSNNEKNKKKTSANNRVNGHNINRKEFSHDE